MKAKGEGISGAFLVIEKRGGSTPVARGKAYPIGRGQVIIGRQEDCNFQVDLAGISRHHARITCESGTYYLADLGSHNGTYLNGERVGAKGMRLRDGDQLQLGHSLTFRFMAPASQISVPAKRLDAAPQRKQTPIAPLRPGYPLSAELPQKMKAADSPFQKSLPAQTLEDVFPSKEASIRVTNQGSNTKLPSRWLPKGSTIVATLSFLAPWIFFLGGCNAPAKEYNAISLAIEGPIVGFNYSALIALPAIIGLAIFVFINAQSKVSQQWIERSTLAMAFIAILPSLDIVLSLNNLPSNLQGYFEFRWGVWVNLSGYGLVVLGAMINLWLLSQLPNEASSSGTNMRTAYRGYVGWNIFVALLLLIGLLTQGDNPEIRRLSNPESMKMVGGILFAVILGGTFLSYILWRNSKSE